MQVVGVVNITEDSFSDGRRYLDPDAAIAQARRLRADGADVIEFEVVPEELLLAGDRVVVIGRYRGRHARSGAPLDVQAVHLWTVVDGRITRHQGFTDTHALHERMST